MSDPHRALLRSLLAWAGEGAAILSSSVTEWSSMTFEGHRHLVAIAPGPAGFADGIAEAELPLPGHIVADIAIVPRAAPGIVTLEALTLRDA